MAQKVDFVLIATLHFVVVVFVSLMIIMVLIHLINRDPILFIFLFPMSVINFQAKQTQKNEFERVILPEDSYQCSIDKVEIKEGTKYMSDEAETQLLFYFRPLGAPAGFERKVLFYQTSTSFFNGKSTSAKQALKASKLYQLIKTIYKFYKPAVKVEDMKPEEITAETINELEGKQIMAIVKINENGNNKVSDVLTIKEEIKEAGQAVSLDSEIDQLMK